MHDFHIDVVFLFDWVERYFNSSICTSLGIYILPHLSLHASLILVLCVYNAGI